MFRVLAGRGGSTAAAAVLATALSMQAQEAQAQEAQAQNACASAVTVASGDTLSSIARRCEVTLDALLEANPEISDAHRISVGMSVVIPGPDWDQSSGFVTGPGDTLGSIARELRLPASTLMEMNPGIDPRDLPSGLVLRVPGDWAESFDAGDGPIATSGVITTIECPAVRGPDGRLYALAGAVTDFRPGDRVEIEGERAEASWCVPGATIEIGQIRAAGSG
jgi:LysM repeat protein